MNNKHFGIFPYWISWMWCKRTTCSFYRKMIIAKTKHVLCLCFIRGKKE